MLQDGHIFIQGLLFRKFLLSSVSVLSIGKKVQSVLGSIVSHCQSMSHVSEEVTGD